MLLVELQGVPDPPCFATTRHWIFALPSRRPGGRGYRAERAWLQLGRALVARVFGTFLAPAGRRELVEDLDRTGKPSRARTLALVSKAAKLAGDQPVW